MASSLVVPIVRVENVHPHPNADKLELCNVLGYQMCIPKGQYKNGDVGIYVPADTLIPLEWAEKWGVTAYLKGKDKNRVGRVRLRGEPSFGLIIPLSWLIPSVVPEVGLNVAEYFNIQKYEPPVKATEGDAAPHDSRIDPFIEKYTDIENGRIFMEVFKDDEEVVATEKIHGGNAKVGVIKTNSIELGNYMFAGSMEIRRRSPVEPDLIVTGQGDDNTLLKNNKYWHPWSIRGVKELIFHLTETAKTVVIMYGEIFGGSVQNLSYGIPKGKGVAFRAFDISVDGKYLNWDDFESLCKEFKVPFVPVLYRGPFSLSKIKELADGRSTVEGSDNIREGTVVKPVVERIDPKIGRAVLKYIGTEYELGKKDGDDSKDV
jgi:RNA ligase (TIGR02306 family)